MRIEVGPPSSGKRLDQFLADSLIGYSRARIQGWLRDGRVLVNGTAAEKASLKLHAGDVLEVRPAELKPLQAKPEAIPLDVLYEDDDVIAINKPAGLVVHAGAGQPDGTLVNALLHHFESLSRVGGDLRPGIVHRIDKGTSGVLLVAKTDAAHQNLAAQFAGRTVDKVYLAIVQGSPASASGEVGTPITRDPVRRTRMTARTGKGRSAHTAWKVLKRWGPFTLLEVKIGTGRTHQIRVHLSSIGLPIAGDALYGAARQPALNRPWLHAARISFDSPSRRNRITIAAPLPLELEAWKNSLVK